MKNEKEINREELAKLGYKENEIDAMFESIFYEDRIVFVDGMYQLKSLHTKTYKDIHCYDLADVKHWIYENTHCNDTYNNVLID